MNQVVGTKENIHRLTKGEPISIRVEDLFPDGIPRRLEVAVYYSETPVADARELAKAAEVTLDERMPLTKRPHCPECRSTIEQIGCWKTQESPVVTFFCVTCGCSLGVEWKL